MYNTIIELTSLHEKNLSEPIRKVGKIWFYVLRLSNCLWFAYIFSLFSHVSKSCTPRKW